VIPLVIIVAYLVGVTAAASMLARRSRDAAAWTVASNRMGLWMIVAGVAGTRIGGVGTYGVAGDVIRTGVWNFWYAINTFLALALVGIFFARAYRRLGLHTVSEIFWLRFGSRRCQVLTSLCVQTEYLIVNVLEPLVIGSILSALTGIPFGLGVLAGAAILILSTTLGGLWGNAVANVIHCLTVVVGLGAVAWLGLDRLGGYDGLRAALDGALATSGADPASWWSPIGAGWGAVIAMFFAATVHTPAASVYVNFAAAARNTGIIVPAFLLAGLLAAIMPVLAGLVGMETLAYYGSDTGLRSYAAITRMAVELNPWIGGLALAAVLAAVISSGGPILLAGATLFLRDWVPAYRGLAPTRQLAALRWTTVIYGLGAAVLAWRADITSILELLLLGFAMVVPPAVAVGFVLYWRRTTELGAFAGIGVGYFAGLLWYLGGLLLARAAESGDAPVLLGGVAQAFAAEAEWTDPSYVTTILPFIVVPIVSLLDRRADDAGRREEFYDRLAPRPDDLVGRAARP
jgi:SSS family solute:Na+ symporter